jgi:NaMN:DMB phosphoribosyltransferase
MVRVLTTPNLDDLEVDRVFAEAVGVIEQPLPPAEDAMPPQAVEAKASGARS